MRSDKDPTQPKINKLINKKKNKVESVTGIYWAEARDTAKYRTVYRSDSSQQRIIWPKMSVALLLRNYVLTNPGKET